jgi:NADH-quinone oxidoreductase subunit J
MNGLALGAPLALAAPLAASPFGAVPGLPPLAFGVLALIAVATALVVVLHRNLVIEALFLVLHLLTVAGLYVLLGAYFFAAIQVIVYAGAILVLIIFVIMLLNLGRESRGRGGMLPYSLALILGSMLVLFLARAARAYQPRTGGLAGDPAWGSVGRIADAMFGPYFFPFEVVSLVLVAGMIGAILLAKRHLED